MSIKHLNWAFKQDLKPGPRFILVAICDYVNENGEWHIKHETLADKTGFSRRAIINHIAALTEEGYLEAIPTRRPDGTQGYNLYRVQMLHPDSQQSADFSNQSANFANQSAENDQPECRTCTALTTQLPPNKPPNNHPVMSAPGFAAFWEAYPRKVGKGTARKAWGAAVKRAPPEQIIAGLESQLDWFAQQYRGPGEDYRPHAATWLRADRWTDQHDEPMNAEQAVYAALEEKWRREEDASEQSPDQGTRHRKITRGRSALPI